MTPPPDPTAERVYRAINRIAGCLVAATFVLMTHFVGIEAGLLTAIAFLAAHISDQLRQLIKILDGTARRAPHARRVTASRIDPDT